MGLAINLEEIEYRICIYLVIKSELVLLAVHSFNTKISYKGSIKKSELLIYPLIHIWLDFKPSTPYKLTFLKASLTIKKAFPITKETLNHFLIIFSEENQKF